MNDRSRCDHDSGGLGDTICNECSGREDGLGTCGGGGGDGGFGMHGDGSGGDHCREAAEEGEDENAEQVHVDRLRQTRARVRVEACSFECLWKGMVGEDLLDG